MRATFLFLRVLASAALLFGASPAFAERFHAPSGYLGAGLSTSKPQKGRVYAEMSMYTGSNGNAFPLIFGGGFKPLSFLELQMTLPIAIGESNTAPYPQAGGVAVGNFQFGANFLFGDRTIRFKGGAALAGGPWTSMETNKDSYWAMRMSGITRWEDAHLWAVESVHLTTPMRLEISPVEHFLISGDLSFWFRFPTYPSDPYVTLILAPGFGFISDVLDAGARFLVNVAAAGPYPNGVDRAQTALEPFLVVNLGQAFLHSRLTINLDQPLGFAFDEGNYWALHWGGGATF